MQVFQTLTHPSKMKPKSFDQEQQEDLSKYLKTFFTLEHLLCCCPFRLKLVDDSESGSRYYIAVGWLPHKIMCILFIILNLFWLIREIRLDLPTSAENKNPSTYIALALDIFSILLKFSIYKTVWLHQAEILEIVNFIIDLNNLLPSQSPANNTSTLKFRQLVRNSTFQLSCLGVVLIGCEVATWILGEHIGRNTVGPDGKRPEWSLAWWWNRILRAGYFNFFISDDGYFDEDNVTLNNLIGLLTAVGYLQRRLTAAYGDLFIMAAVVTLRSSVVAFSTSLQIPPDVLQNKRHFMSKNGATMDQRKSNQIHIMLELGQIYQPHWTLVNRQYSALKTLSKLINGLLGSVFGYYLLEFILYYAIMFDELFVTINWLQILRITFYFGQAVVMLLLAADIPKQMNMLKDWMSVKGNRSSIPADEQNLILNELDSKVVSIKGNNVLPIQHSTLANMLAVTVTYFIICVQV